MAGMFSLLGVLFGLPLTEVLSPVDLSAPLEAALLEKKGEIGDVLSALEAADAFDATDSPCGTKRFAKRLQLHHA